MARRVSKADMKHTELQKAVLSMAGRYSAYEIFTDWIEVSALAMANSTCIIQDKHWQTREEKYNTIMNKYSHEEQMMDLDEAIQHCEKVAGHCYECADGGCSECEKEHHQLAEWLKELKAYKDARAEINQALYDDARGEQNDYECGRKSGIFLCESIISVKLGESSSEIPNKSEIPTSCGDAISRAIVQEEITKSIELKENPYQLWDRIRALPSVTPQQRTGRWIEKEEEGEAEPFIIWECSECHGYQRKQTTFCPNCGAKMEVES